MQTLLTASQNKLHPEQHWGRVSLRTSTSRVLLGNLSFPEQGGPTREKTVPSFLKGALQKLHGPAWGLHTPSPDSRPPAPCRRSGGGDGDPRCGAGPGASRPLPSAQTLSRPPRRSALSSARSPPPPSSPLPRSPPSPPLPQAGEEGRPRTCGWRTGPEDVPRQVCGGAGSVGGERGRGAGRARERGRRRRVGAWTQRPGRPVPARACPIASVTGLRAPTRPARVRTPASPGTGRGGSGAAARCPGPPPERERGLHVRDAPTVGPGSSRGQVSLPGPSRAAPRRPDPQQAPGQAGPLRAAG